MICRLDMVEESKAMRIMYPVPNTEEHKMNPEASYEAKLEKMQFMTPEEKFIFDLDGYIVIKDVLTPEEVAELNAITDEKQGLAKDQDGYKNIGKPSTWGAPFQALIDHPKTVPYLIELPGL